MSLAQSDAPDTQVPECDAEVAKKKKWERQVLDFLVSGAA